MRRAIDETARRRERQLAYNDEHGITPTTIVKAIDDVLASVYERDYLTVPPEPTDPEEVRTHGERVALIARLEQEMKAAAQNLEFERAAGLRDRLKKLRTRDLGLAGEELTCRLARRTA